MARIRDEVVERLKEEVDLAELVGRSGVALQQTGKDLVGRCPFHDDDTPSLVVTPAKGLWHCMGACQAGGSVIDWVMRTEGVSFRHAVELLRAGAPVTIGRAGTVKHSFTRRLPAPVERDATDDELLAQVVAYYHRTLTESPEALAYLARRRIDRPEVIDAFSLGYANRTLGLRLPNRQTKEGGAIRGRLIALGVYRASGHEHLAGSVVVPVRDPAGRVTDLYGRKVTPNLRAGTALHLYLPGSHKGVFNEAGLATGEVIVCESLVDALTLWCCGFEHVTCAYGTAGFTPAHHEAFARHQVTRVLIAYDHDPAGDTAAETLAHDLMGEGIECFRVQLPVGQDVNDVAVAARSPRDALGKAVREAAWMGTGTPRRPAAPPATRRQAGPAPLPSAAPPPPPAAPAPAPEPPAPPAPEPQIPAVPAPSPAPAAAPTEPTPAPAPVAPSSTPPASPVPEAPSLPAAAVTHDELAMTMGERRWRVRQVPKRPTPGSLRVTVMVSAGERFHLDTCDLYAARQRAGFCDAAAAELRATRDQLATELGRVLLATEQAQAAAGREEPSPAAPAPTGEARDQALALLSAPDLLDEVAGAFGTLGVVGERDGALVAWLTLTSRSSDRPLGAVIQSSSSAGKSTLADAALALVPAEATVSYSAMTGQALYYLGETDLAHKVLAIAEEEGAARATYALKLLVSEGRLSIAAAGKDPVTGRLTTHTYEVTGPVALLMTTTAAALTEELANRLLVVAVTESRAQTRAVQRAQRQAETLEGLVARASRAALIARHHDAQRLLAPVAVVNPCAPDLTFSDRATRHRRDHAKLLGLIRAVTLAHQHQRPRRQVQVGGQTVTYIETTPSDVAAAERLAARVLATTTDELSPATRRLLVATRSFAARRGERSFTRRELREATGMGDTQLKVHLARLVDLEYVVANRAGPATTYELADDGTDPDRSGGAGDRSGERGDRSGIGRVRRHSGGRPFPQVAGADDEEPARSVGIGRVPRHSHDDPFPQVDGPDGDEEADRSGPGALRVLGTGAEAGVEGSAPLAQVAP